MSHEKSDRVTVRLDSELRDLVVHVASVRRVSVSDIVRGAILQELGKHSYLDQSTKKAIGISSETREAPSP